MTYMQAPIMTEELAPITSPFDTRNRYVAVRTNIVNMEVYSVWT